LACKNLAASLSFALFLASILAIAPANASLIPGIAAYTFDDVSGTSVPDGTGNGNTGTLINGATTSTNAPFTHYPPSNNSLSLDGVDDFMAVADLTDFTVDATIEGWVNPSSLGAENWVWKVARDGDPSTYYAARLVSGTVQAFFGNRTGTAQSTATLPSGDWTHLAVTYSTTGGVNIFVNGSPDGSAAWTNTSNLGSSVVQLLLGTENGVGNFFDGLMDEVRISEGILSNEQIAADSQHTFVPEPTAAAMLGAAGLLAGYRWPRPRRRA
jgi:hypothetical protein